MEGEGWGEGNIVENGAMLTTFIQIYSRMHHFVVKFSKLSSPQAARGHSPPNQNPADALAVITGRELSLSLDSAPMAWWCNG